MNQDSASGEQFREKLILLIVDKALIGLLLVLIGLLATLLIEKAKAQLILFNEASKTRIQVIAAYIEKQRTLELKILRVYEEFAEAFGQLDDSQEAKDRLFELVHPNTAALKKDLHDLSLEVASSDSWLGHRLAGTLKTRQTAGEYILIGIENMMIEDAKSQLKTIHLPIPIMSNLK